MSFCLICGEDGVDISQDFCSVCVNALFQQDQLGNNKPAIEREILGLERLKKMAPDNDYLLHLDTKIAALKKQLET
jgi:hypothetical protein